MKKIILFILTLFLSLTASRAQSIEQLFEKYKETKNVEKVKICPKLLKGASKILVGLAEFSTDLTEEDKQGIQLLEKIEEIQFVAANRSTIDFHKDIKGKKFLRKNKYEMLLEKSSKEEDVFVYSQDSKKDLFSNLLVFITDKDDKSSLLAYIKGEIDPEDVSKLIALAHRESKKHRKGCDKK